MATYIRFLEEMVASNDIKTFWRSKVGPNDRRSAALSVKKFIEQHGKYIPRAMKYPSDEAAWLDCFYYFPTMPLPKESPLRDRKNLVRLYKFFFSPITVTETYAYE